MKLDSHGFKFTLTYILSNFIISNLPQIFNIFSLILQK